MPTISRKASACWTHPGSYIDQIGIQIKSDDVDHSALLLDDNLAHDERALDDGEAHDHNSRVRAQALEHRSESF